MNQQATTIGSNTYVKGNLHGEEDLIIEGRFDGKIALNKSLTIEPSGVVVADIQVSHAVINGTLVGNVQATEIVQITEKGKVEGDILAPRVILLDGASFKGKIEMGPVDPSRFNLKETPRNQTASSAASSTRPTAALRGETPTRAFFAGKTDDKSGAAKKDNAPAKNQPAVISRPATTSSAKTPVAPPKPPTTAGKKNKIIKRR